MARRLTKAKTCRPAVSKGKSRFEQAGMEGLQERSQGSQLRRAARVVQAQDPVSTTETIRWQRALVVPQAERGIRRQQVDSAANSGAGQVAAPPAEPLHGLQRSGVLKPRTPIAPVAPGSSGS